MLKTGCATFNLLILAVLITWLKSDAFNYQSILFSIHSWFKYFSVKKSLSMTGFFVSGTLMSISQGSKMLPASQ